MKLLKTLTVVAAAVCCVTATSQAVLVLAPGTPSTALGPDAPLDGAAVTITSMSTPFAGLISGHFTGTLNTTVLQESLAFNPLGGYTFVYQVLNAATSVEGLGRLTVDGWKNAILPVAGNTGAGTDASTADRSVSGDVIGFTWVNPPGVPIGGFGLLFVRTGISAYTTTMASVIDGTTATGIATLAVPEPTTMIAGALLLLPFGASTLRFVRKNRVA